MAMNGDVNGAAKKYIESIEITSEMVYSLIIELQKLKIQFIVAPYEADAQLTYLFKNNKIDLVITEDSDLLLFGASKCFFKMDLQGRGLEIDLDDLPRCDLFKAIKPVPCVDRCKEMLLKICMLSGCDYI